MINEFYFYAILGYFTNVKFHNITHKIKYSYITQQQTNTARQYIYLYM